jgi:hypothetical protein
MKTKEELAKEIMNIKRSMVSNRKSKDFCTHKEKALQRELVTKGLELQKIQPDNKSKGLGDTVKKVTEKLGIKQCGGCKRRQEKLNRLFPYGKDGKKEG